MLLVIDSPVFWFALMVFVRGCEVCATWSLMGWLLVLATAVVLCGLIAFCVAIDTVFVIVDYC